MSWNVLGHEWAADLLKQHIEHNEVRHAYLFTGPAGVGRRTLALRFAQAVNCTEPTAPGQPCGKCRICRQTEQMQQSDLSIVESLEGSHTLKVEQVRDLQHSLSLAPYESHYRIALLKNFQEANDNAQNALLKTLEEAPERVIMLLTADSAENLLPTISSRCEILRLRPMPVETLASALVDRWHVGQEDARLLSHLSGGRLGSALALNENRNELDQRSAWLDDLNELIIGTRRDRFRFVELNFPGKEFKKDREKLRQMLLVWQTFWRDVMLTAAGANVPLINLDRTDEIERLAQLMDVENARSCTARMDESLDWLEKNANPRLLAEVLLLDLPRIQLGQMDRMLR